MKVTVAQVPVQKDLGRIKEIVEENSSSELIVFPEEVFFVDSLKIIDELKKVVEQNSTSIVIGIALEKYGKSYNYAYFISQEKVERYQKVHVHWSENYVPGNEFKVVDAKFGKLGLLICFDSSFPEAGRILALKGAEIIAVIHAVPKHFPYKYSLLRSRAIALDNQLFVLDCCKTGEKYTGHSAIINPYGEEITKEGRKKSVVTRDIDLGEVEKWRAKEKIFPHRRPGLYGLISDF